MEFAKLCLKLLIASSAFFTFSIYAAAGYYFYKQKDIKDFTTFFKSNKRVRIASKISYTLFSACIIGFIMLFILGMINR